jgi:uncharacterized protein with HEPN domain
MFLDDPTRLRHMRDAARKIIAFAEGRQRTDLDNDDLLVHGVINLLEIIGEAASSISQGTRDKLPDIPWRQVVAMRNRLIHAYHSIDLDIVWGAATEEVPQLAATLEAYLGEGD